MPYRDAWDHKGPATYLPSAAAQVLFGQNLWSLRLADALLLVVTLGAQWLLARRWCGRFGAHAATLLFLYLYRSLGYWNTAQPDGWATMAMTAAPALVLLNRQPGCWRLIVAGLLLGLGVMFKITRLRRSRT